TARSGGLLRERGLIAARERFQADAAACHDWLAGLGIPAVPDGEEQGARPDFMCKTRPCRLAGSSQRRTPSLLQASGVVLLVFGFN
ncbi:hypothetical protein GPA27_28830, partial [Aromatoleum toluolicum]|nr:hypothetical protein [Aromatoleum toluolicum]